MTHLPKNAILGKQDKERGQIAITPTIQPLSERFAKWDTHLRERKKHAFLACLAPATESASPRWSSRKTRGCYSNLILLRFRLQSRSIQASTIKIRSTLLADLIFMAPATGIEPVTNH